jgi:peptide/nickel transport system substrate-binding protein
MVSRRKLAVGIGVVAVAAVSLLAANWAGAQGKAQTLPRDQLLITSGTAWGPESNFNPFGHAWATGMVGLVNETLLRYDPLRDKYLPWLATSAGFKGKKYVITVRSGVKFTDGTAFTPQVVVSDINLQSHKTGEWHVLWTNIKKMAISGNKITVTFKGTPNYIQWQNMMWNMPMVLPSQFASITDATFTTMGSSSGWVPIGTGPYVLDTQASDPSQGVVWKKAPSWWASSQGVAPSPAPTYIEDLVNTSNTNALEGLLKDVEDLNNNYLPGIQQLVANGQAQTYFPGKPYDLSANTAWLEVNTTKTPLNDPAFRRALAESVNIPDIVGPGDYKNLVLPANQTGLLNVWTKWVDHKLVTQYGFKKNNPADAKKVLKAAGYKFKGGFVVNKNGKPINLTIEVPSGWSDWEAARSIVVASAARAGIKVTPKIGSQAIVQTTDRNQGKFDLEIDNAYQLSDNPWTYYNGIFHLPIITKGTGQTFANYGRYNNPVAWKLVLKLDMTPPSKLKQRHAIVSQLQSIFLQQLPIIPLWYNGIWAQTQSSHWTNWPSSTGMHYIPCMWGGYLQMTGIDTITHIKPAH